MKTDIVFRKPAAARGGVSEARPLAGSHVLPPYHSLPSWNDAVVASCTPDVGYKHWSVHVDPNDPTASWRFPLQRIIMHEVLHAYRGHLGEIKPDNELVRIKGELKFYNYDTKKIERIAYNDTQKLEEYIVINFIDNKIAPELGWLKRGGIHEYYPGQKTKIRKQNVLILSFEEESASFE